MDKLQLKIPNISCNHCVLAVKNELSELKGMLDVDGDAETKSISIQFDDPLTIDEIKAVLAEINYPAA